MKNSFAQHFESWLFISFTLFLMTGCINHRPMVYTPDVALSNEQQPCVSIPRDEAGQDIWFDVQSAGVFREGVGQVWERIYFDPENLSLPSKYQIRAGECLRFDYFFEKNITYSVDFTTTAHDKEKSKKWKQKLWTREIQIKKESNGSVLLLLDVEARKKS